ncbi:MAG: hypothetical protein EOP07_03620 [Proteobacteria bacterium]|nr:MAG: hypothetical protein EOP07_03620 [Pseudomonadota bacterium]
MTKHISLPALLLVLIGTSAIAAPRQARAQTLSKRFDFAAKPQSSFQTNKIDFFFSDVPANQVVNGRDLSKLPGATLAERLTAELAAPMAEKDLYQLTQVYDRMDSKVSGQVIGYHNRSDDTDVNFQIVVGNSSNEKLKPNTVYQITAKLDFVTNVSSELFGIGGSADSNSFGLAVSQNPWVSAVPSGTPSVPSQPTEPSLPSDGDVGSYFGIPGSFFIDQSELSDLADASFDSLTQAEIAIVAKGVSVSPSQSAAYKAALLKNLNAAYAKALSNLGKVQPADVLQVRLTKELDLNVKAKLSEMSPEDIEQLKSMFGEGSGPVVLAATSVHAAASDSAEIRRTTTVDSAGNTVALGVPSGTCNNAPLSQLEGDDRWICERYSYMGRINNGKDEAHKEWTANSVSTQAPLEFTTDASGKPLYLNLNSHSGFEGLTVYYVTGIEYKIVEKK